MLDEMTLADADPTFNSMQNIVHMDEKWFNMTKKRKHYYLLPKEKDPERTVQNKNKNLIGKLMFLTAMARQRIGVWPFVTVTAAAKNCKNKYNVR
jgi:hypothetical protein